MPGDSLVELSANGYSVTANGGASPGAASLIPGDTDGGALALDGANDYYSTAYETRRNLVANPRLAVNATGWDAWNAVTVTRVSGLHGGALPEGPATDGSWEGAMIDTTGAGDNEGVQITFAVVSGHTYTLSIYLHIASLGGGSGAINSQVLTGGFATAIGETISAPVGTWIRVDHTFTAAATEDYRYIPRTTGTGVAKFYLTGALVDETSSTLAYFDGSGYVNDSGAWVSDAGGKVGWLGAAHASASDNGAIANGTRRDQAGLFARDDTSAAHTLWGGSATSSATRLVLASGSRNVLFIVGGTTYTYTAAWPDDADAHFWEHSFDEASDTADLYIDGVLFEHKTGVTAQHAPSQSFQIGAHGAGSDPAHGKGQHILAFEDGLTVGEIAHLSDLFLTGKVDVLSSAQVAVVEQDSIEDITGCVFSILATERGTRPELPEFGITDPTFRLGGVDLDELRDDVEEWEPRAETFTESQWDGLLQEVRVRVGV